MAGSRAPSAFPAMSPNSSPPSSEATDLADQLQAKNEAYEEEVHLAREIQQALTGKGFPGCRQRAELHPFQRALHSDLRPRRRFFRGHPDRKRPRRRVDLRRHGPRRALRADRGDAARPVGKTTLAGRRSGRLPPRPQRRPRRHSRTRRNHHVRHRLLRRDRSLSGHLHLFLRRPPGPDHRRSGRRPPDRRRPLRKRPRPRPDPRLGLSGQHPPARPASAASSSSPTVCWKRKTNRASRSSRNA